MYYLQDVNDVLYTYETFETREDADRFIRENCSEPDEDGIMDYHGNAAELL